MCHLIQMAAEAALLQHTSRTAEQRETIPDLDDRSPLVGYCNHNLFFGTVLYSSNYELVFPGCNISRLLHPDWRYPEGFL